MNITILYGTETGNAEMLAEDIAAELEGDHEVECSNLCDFSPDSFDTGQFYLIVCSTYGDGELPASAQPFAESMNTANVDLSGVYFSIFGLGDSEYDETFNFGSKQVGDLLTARGAVRVGDWVAHDASGADMAEDVASPWAQDVVAEGQSKMNGAT